MGESKKNGSNFSLPQKWRWQYWRRWRTWTIWTVPQLHLVVFRFLFSSDHTATCLTW